MENIFDEQLKFYNDEFKDGFQLYFILYNKLNNSISLEQLSYKEYLNNPNYFKQFKFLEAGSMYPRFLKE